MSASYATRRLLAAALAAGALIGAAAVPAAAHDGDRRDHRGRYSSIVIGDVQHESSRGRGRQDLNREWVEVRNTGRHSVELRGFTLTDSDGNRYRFNRLRLDGRSSVKVHTGHGRDTHRDVYQNRRHQIWDESDTATLRDDHGNVLDAESWGRRGHRDDRNNRDDRSHRNERNNRDDRSHRNDRNDRGDRGDRGDRNERGDRRH
ncbi:lamin tail domain-containing protein [Streptomyces sp. NPDC090445]|uniref:lamin tail domain-containing protein n=1 Tax=Streptomyces sp. NPDC090445 TaxID=3365963 RepID=UPI0038105982